MPKINAYELEVLSAFDKGHLQSVATKTELAKFKAAARATAIKDRRVNIRRSSGDLSDIQVSPAFSTSTLPADWLSRVQQRKLPSLHPSVVLRK